MLTICLRILSILGMILLILVLAAVILLALALFVPVTYRLSGKIDGNLRINVRIKWLAGLLRVRYGYPDPGYLTAKALCFTLLKARIPPDEKDKADRDSRDGKMGRDKDSGSNNPDSHSALGQGDPGHTQSPGSGDSGYAQSWSSGDPGHTQSSGSEDTGYAQSSGMGNSGHTQSSGTGESGHEQSSNPGDSEHTQSSSQGDSGSGDSDSGSGPEASGSAPASVIGKILQKFEKIKYTIQGIYDKIKKIWNNISYYVELLQEENTRQLFVHARRRLGKIAKSIRPRHIRADILFGTGAPDATGYLYGAYCMISPALGTKVCVTPDFQEKVLRGEFDLSGRITMCVLLVNGGKLLMDRRLRLLIRKLRAAGRDLQTPEKGGNRKKQDTPE